ncbi:MAG: hypothetical protein PVF87_08280 [Acidimicrobiia bacterium]|jgi:hypothetical protein
MRRVPWIAAVLIVILAACAQVEPVLLQVTMPDCTYMGETSIEEGEISLSLRLNGLADAGVLVAELSGEHAYGDLATHVEEISDELADLPTWAETVVDLRLSDSEGIDGVERSARLSEGDYAVICVDYPYDQGPPLVRLAAPLTVED